MDTQKKLPRKCDTDSISIVTQGILAANSSSETFTQLSTTASTNLSSSDLDKKKTSVQLIGALARSSPRRVGRRLPEFMPKIIEAARTDDDELRETTLQVSRGVVAGTELQGGC